MKKNINKGIFFAFITSVISGIAIFYAKLFALRLPALALASTRNLYVGFLFFIYLVFTKKIKTLKQLKKKDWFLLTIIGLIGGSLPFYLFFSGLKLVSPQTANLIHKSLFIWVSLLAYLFLKEQFSFKYWLAFIIILLANYFFNSFNFIFGQGELMILIATWLWAVENIIAKKVLKTVSSEVVGFFRMAFGGFVLFLLLIVNNQVNSILNLELDQLIGLFIGATILFFYVYFWYKSLKYAPASLVTLILTFSTVIGNLLQNRFLKINLLPQEIYSSVMIALAVGLFLKQGLKGVFFLNRHSNE